MKSNTFYDLTVDIKNCKTEKDLLKIIQYIVANQKKLRLDDYDMQRLESIGMQKYESMTIERQIMVRNKKI